MRGAKEKMSLNDLSFNGVMLRTPLLTRGLLAPYQQQIHDINKMLQNETTVELSNQLNSLEDRAVVCMKLKDKVLYETMKRIEEMDIRLKKALAEAEYWRKMESQKTDLCSELFRKLVEVRKRGRSRKRTLEKNLGEKAESSTGDNGDYVVNTATEWLERRRL